VGRRLIANALGGNPSAADHTEQVNDYAEDWSLFTGGRLDKSGLT
jgi:hypothetical protein